MNGVTKDCIARAICVTPASAARAGAAIADEEWEQIRTEVIGEDLGFSRSHARRPLQRQSL